ncbi:putative tetratricopeptide-like helical domain superfamily [Helianthus annuus]|nr:putative tetratricopeptide-like helical domain superfamily [Helianthus annuus]
MILLRKIIDNGLWPERLTYNILVDGFCREDQLDMGFRLLKLVDSLYFVSDQFAYTTLIDRLSKDGKLDQANGLLGFMMKKGIHPDEVTFTAIINGYCKNRRIENAVTVLDTTLSSKILTLTGPHIFNLLIDTFSKDMKFGLAYAMIAKMLKCCVTPSVVTYTTLIDGFCQTGDINRSLEVFELMKRCNCAPNVYTYTVLVNGYCQTGTLEEAVKLLNTMYDSGVSPNVITYIILIKAYVKSGDLENAFEILNDMVKKKKKKKKNKCQPNFETFSALLEGLVLSKSVTDGSLTVFKELGSSHVVEFLQKAKKHGVGDSDLYSFLITGLYKAGRILEGDELVQEIMKKKIAWIFVLFTKKKGE